MRYLSPQAAVPLLIVALAGTLWFCNPGGRRALLERPAATTDDREGPAVSGAAVAPSPSPRLLPREHGSDWLPALVDDTRTVLTGFAVGMEDLGRRQDPRSAVATASTTGPRLFPAGQQWGQPSAQEPAPWFPETRAAAPSAAQAPRLLIVPPEAAVPRSRDLEMIAREADAHSRRGFELAGRGACFSARAEFVLALRLLAQGLDAERRTTMYSTRLAVGLTALKEAEDFLPSGSRVEADLNLRSILAGHRTPVLRAGADDGLTPLAALQCYFTFSQEQLASAVDREMAGSMALYGLGKLHQSLSDDRTSAVRAARAKAVVFYQASLLVCPENHMASNELGVLLAQAGRFEDARMALEHSVALHQGIIGWHNLAVVYGQLGRSDLAQRAERLAQAARQSEAAQAAGRAARSQKPVVWVDPQAFARDTKLAPRAETPGTRTPAETGGVPSQPAPAPGPNVARFPFSPAPNR